jgi:hypothetical protein
VWLQGFMWYWMLFTHVQKWNSGYRVKQGMPENPLNAYRCKVHLPFFERVISMRRSSLAQDPIRKSQSDIFDKSDSRTILTKSNRKGRTISVKRGAFPWQPDWQKMAQLGSSVLSALRADKIGILILYTYLQLIYSLFVINNNETNKEIPFFSYFSIIYTFSKAGPIFLITEIETVKLFHSFWNGVLLYDVHTFNEFVLAFWSLIFREKRQFLFFPLRLLYQWHGTDSFTLSLWSTKFRQKHKNGLDQPFLPFASVD